MQKYIMWGTKRKNENTETCNALDFALGKSGAAHKDAMQTWIDSGLSQNS